MSKLESLLLDKNKKMEHELTQLKVKNLLSHMNVIILLIHECAHTYSQFNLLQAILPLNLYINQIVLICWINL